MQDEKDMKIGSVTLDLSQYSGNDLYCDGEIEDRLLEIVRDHSDVEFGKIIEESKSWPILYHLSPLRENIIDWIPLTKDMKVLEVGAGCGAITGSLARHAGHVDCVDLSLKRSKINAYRHMDCDNIDIHVGNFMDIEPDLPGDYDYIMLIGVFEYGQAYIGENDPYETFLKLLKKHLGDNGRIVIAIENRFGLKYWAGCREDHLGTFFGGIGGYSEDSVVKTFSEKELMHIAVKSGFSDINMYYPYPDYKFMTDLYSMKRLPQRGELNNNRCNYDNDRLELFDESIVFDAMIEEKTFPIYSNSYLMLLGSELPIEYVRYGNDRAPEYCIRTDIRCDKGVRTAVKMPSSDLAVPHIARIMANKKKLCERYEGGKLDICGCHMAGDASGAVVFDHIQGVPLSEMMAECEAQGDIQGFGKLFDEYMRRISYKNPDSAPVSDIDLIFQNIIVDGDKWTAIDYEWVYDEDMDPAFIAFRALMYYTKHEEKHEKLNLDEIISKLGLTSVQMEDIREDEEKLQTKILGRRRKTMPMLRDMIDNRIYSLDYLCSLINRENERIGRERVQIFEDTGKGFTEGDSAFYSLSGDGGFDMTFRIKRGRSAVRLDPCEYRCIVQLKSLTWNGTDVNARTQISVNGTSRDGMWIFNTDDPNIVIDLLSSDNPSWNDRDENELHIVMEVSRITESVAEKMTEKSSFFDRITNHNR